MRSFKQDHNRFVKYEDKVAKHFCDKHNATVKKYCAYDEQIVNGDLEFTKPDGTIVNVEVKADTCIHKSGNFAIETWSDKDKVKGWLYKLENVDYLAYIDTQKSKMYVLPWKKLQEYVQFNKPSFEHTNQKTSQQLNDSWVLLVPAKELVNNIDGAYISDIDLT